jgi:hypothetical protein
LSRSIQLGFFFAHLLARSSVSMAAALLTVVLLVFVASAAASRQLEEDAMLGSLAPAPAPLLGAAAGLAAPGAWAVAAVVSLLAFLAQ